MLRFCLFFLVFSSIFLACKVPQKAVEISKKESYLFPLDWIGHYKGELLIFNASPDTNKVIMQLTIGNPNAEGFYPWTLQYGEDDIRNYGLEAINSETGHFILDEHNSIRLDGYLRDNHFISRFEVMGSDLLVDYERVSDGILVNLYVSQMKEISTTGGQIFGKDTVPNVRSFAIPVFQRALLKKQ